jgi:hypothetical protein
MATHTPESIINFANLAEVSPQHKALDPHRAVKQSKKLSQLIAISWGDDQKAGEIRKIFLNFYNTSLGKQDEAYQEMKNLLSGQKPELFEKIFDEDEIEDYFIQITWDSFEGSVTDMPQAIMKQQPPFFILTLPYPPKPSDFNYQNENLQKWLKELVNVDDSSQKVTNPFPPIPYVPQTTC